jgi:hypothetical protein
VALERLLQGPRGDIPELDCVIVGAGRHQIAVQGDCHHVSLVRVAIERLLHGPCNRIPELDPTIVGAGRHQLAI